MIEKNDNLLAILGPTNTGKTYFAFEKLFSYSSGIFGFPLRLLARENYDKAIKRVGINNVALITGEEKILPKEAKYFFCTVESMPVKKHVECVIIDEVQLAADYERGHIFTDRIINSRGIHETIFLGSMNIKNILKELFPKIKIQYKERFSILSFTSKQNISKLKPRSAIIAFNINKVYEIAERIRTHKGGAAVVLGSLSPRTRNAQVEIYENNNVDYLVATDAIGMGLNLNIDNICFTALEKFDGKYNRNLHSHEVGQIAGRAGRYKNNGTFGYTKEAGELDPITLQAIENHNYPQIQKIYWRNSNLDFTSIETLISSLKKYPIKNFFIHKKNASDELNFKILLEDNDIKAYLKNDINIKLLWDVCRIPDFEKVFNDNYIMFLKNIFLTLLNNNYKIPEDWINNKILKLENFNGGISELSIKISQIRTWTYISNHLEWLENPLHWQERTQKIENDLSDNLHIGLTNKFIDASSKYFITPSEVGKIEKIEINQKNEIILDNYKYGYVSGFNIILDKNLYSHSLFSQTHVKKSIRNMIEEKIENFLNAPNDSLNFGLVENNKFNDQCLIYWGNEPVGVLKKGQKIYKPNVEVQNNEFLSSEKKLLILTKLQAWVDSLISETLKNVKEKLDNELSPQVRRIAYNCFENLGIYPIKNFKDEINELNIEDKSNLSKLGIRLGAKYFFTPILMKKKPIELKSLLWKVFNNFDSEDYLPIPKDGRVSFSTSTKVPENYWLSIGYICINNFAFRIDVFEKIFYLARKKIKFGPFIEAADLMSPIGCNSEQLQSIMKFCGYESFVLVNDKKMYYQLPNNKIEKSKKNSIKSYKKRNNKNKTKKLIKSDPNSPFAVLEKLL